jgi:mgtE-like transporter
VTALRTPWTVPRLLRATVPIVGVLVGAELAAGVVLDGAAETLFARPSLLVLAPVAIGTAGNLGSVLAARLSTAVHLGTVSFTPRDPTLTGNAGAVLLLAAGVFPAVGAAAWGLARVTTGTVLPPSTVVAVAAASGVALGAIAVIVAVAATYAAYRLELDPDDVLVPLVTTVCDTLGVVVLIGTVRLLV